jgi:hypothetical protein
VISKKAEVIFSSEVINDQQLKTQRLSLKKDVCGIRDMDDFSHILTDFLSSPHQPIQKGYKSQEKQKEQQQRKKKSIDHTLVIIIGIEHTQTQVNMNQLIVHNKHILIPFYDITLNTKVLKPDRIIVIVKDGKNCLSYFLKKYFFVIRN